MSATDNKGKSKENRKKYLSSTGLEASFELGQPLITYLANDINQNLYTQKKIIFFT